MHVEYVLNQALPGTGEYVDFSGRWKNQLGSKMEIKQAADKLSGTYTSYVSEDGSETIGELAGFVDGTLASFVVHWRKHQAITAWVGQINSKTQELGTLWQMTRHVDPGKEWISINAGADAFVRVT